LSAVADRAALAVLQYANDYDFFSKMQKPITLELTGSGACPFTAYSLSKRSYIYKTTKTGPD
jgi:hypothetical protein